MRRILLLIGLVALMALTAAPARATDYRVDLGYPAADQSILRAAVGAGFAACGGGATGNLCRTVGPVTAHAAPNLAIPAWNAADFIFTPPPGTTIVSGIVTVRFGATDAGIHGRLLYRMAGGLWTPVVLADRATPAVVSVGVPAGVAQFGPSLYARTNVPAGRITSPTANVLEMQHLVVLLRDLGPPTVSLRAGSAFSDGAWHRGVVCAHADGADGGLGVFAVYLDVDGQRVAAAAPVGGVMQPRPRVFGGDLCIDTHLLHDGYLTAVFRATDGTVAGGNAAATTGSAIRVDNTPPTLAGSIAADTADRQPEVVARSVDALSGLVEISASVGGVGVSLTPAADGSWHGRPVAPLPYGAHVARFHATDAAGNIAETTAAVMVADRVPPTVDGFTGGADGFSFGARDAESGLSAAGIAVALDARDVDAAGTFAGGAFRYVAPAPLAPGTHSVVAHVTDNAGNVTTQTWTFAIAAPPPGPVAPVVPAPLVLRFAVASITVRVGATHVTVRALRGATPERGLRIAFSWPGSVRAGSSVTDERGIADLVLDGRREGTLTATAAGARAQLVVHMARGITLTARRVKRVARLAGTVLPAKAAIVIEAYAAGRWKAVRTLRVTRGKFSTRIALKRKGLYIFRATTGEARSPAVQVWLR